MYEYGPRFPVALPRGLDALTMLDVEAEYDRYWREVAGMARVERAFSLYAEMRAMLEFQVRKRHPELSEKEIPWEVARLMFLSDEGTQRLLEQARAKLC